MRLVRHLFGIDEHFLHEEMSRRQQTHAVGLAAAQNALARQRANNAQKRRYIELLERELLHLTRRRDGLLQAIERDMAAAADPSPPCDAQTESNLSIAQLQQRLAQHRALHKRILAEVMAVLSPFVSHPARPRYGGK